jgi:hypothetical protein
MKTGAYLTAMAVAGLLLTPGLPSMANDFWKQAPEAALKGADSQLTSQTSADLAMPGMGLTASAVQLEKRIRHAVELGQISTDDAQDLWSRSNRVRTQIELLRSMGNLSFEEGQKLANSISAINDQLEQKSQSPEAQRQSLISHGKDVVNEKETEIRQRISDGLSGGRLSGDQARKYKHDLRQIVAQSKSASSLEEYQLATRDLNKLGRKVEHDISSSQLSSKPMSYLNFPRTY